MCQVLITIFEPELVVREDKYDETPPMDTNLLKDKTSEKLGRIIHPR